MSSNQTKGKRLFATALSCLMLLGATQAPALSAEMKLKSPTNRPLTRPNVPKVTWQEDILLITPDMKADNDEVKDALSDVHGTVVATLGDGRLKMLVVKCEKGKFAETEKKLTADKKHFTAVGRNYRFAANVVPNDPKFSSSWHLTAMNCPKAWDKGQGGAKIAVLDSGCQASVADLNGKVEKGFDANTPAAKALGGILMASGSLPGVTDLAGAIAAEASSGANTDQNGHGTWVASAAVAAMNNSQVTAGIAPSSTVYPIRIADAAKGSTAMTDDLSVACAMFKVFTSGARIVNLSYGGPYYGFHNPVIHGPLHKIFMEYYYARQGLIFLSAGNDAIFDGTPNCPYINMVSAIDSSGNLADFSNYGTIVDFTAPGKGIVVTDIDGLDATVNGTSFSCPIVAAVASLILSKNPALPNVAVEGILKASCVNSTPGWNPYFGWGMPDAKKAVDLATFGL
ncbi:MAG TPA: S8 family serine peptidase [Candidatus Obscuribacter sp.]|nr:S8 family serine peptidase [Candidatus Obscuribacter sp.]HMY02064.1 S8 family serine peptidase [Candidatus Obscuribacter sp.]HMY52952.1 S8 family serine peptidase [Candidatus Obscuribacter sp.]HNB14804.1 S8 family serine peptidase [Candidatus Obscuribacter sp.]HND04468.1 S8 family serine peptidase [Candidatus Obscuribacter sp.]